MALSGWHRILIVTAATWALAVTGLATLEFQADQGQVGDGFFTCAEPNYPLTPSSTRYWSRECGLFPRTWVAKGLFDDLPPHVRYLNVSWFLAILLGPPALFGLCTVALVWIVRGFRAGTAADGLTEFAKPEPAEAPAQSEAASQNRALAWLAQMPRRWARNAAIGAAILAAPVIMPPLSRSDAGAIAFMLVGLGVVTLGSAVTGYLCGRWGRSSLRASFLMSPASALPRIMPNWITGAILLGTLLLASDALFGWRASSPFASGNSYRNWGYLTGFFGTWMLSGYLAGLVSKRGLRKAIAADLQRQPSAESPMVSYCLPFQTSAHAPSDFNSDSLAQEYRRMLAHPSSKRPSHARQKVAAIATIGRARSMTAAAILAFGISGCATVAEQVSGEIETRRAVCRQQTFKTNVERAACHNAAEARLGEIWGGGLAAVRRQTRLVIAERQDRKELTDAEAELAFAKVNADLTAQATRRVQAEQLAQAQYDAALAQRRSLSMAPAQPAASGSVECVSRAVSGELRTECRDNGVSYIRTNPAIR